MGLKELHKIIKNEKKDYIVIVKTKNSYKTFGDDAIIMWYIFNYKYFDNTVTFGNNAFDKVINKLKKININFMIVTKIEELLSCHNSESTYSHYYELANQSYKNYQRKIRLVNKLKVIFNSNPDCYDEVNLFLDNIMYQNNK